MFSPFSILNISCHSLLACRVSAEQSAVKHMWFPLCVTCCFTLAAFNILSLCLILVRLISMSLCVSLWVYTVWDSLYLLDLIDDFLFLAGEIFDYNLFKIFLIFFLGLFFSWYPYNSNVSSFDIVPVGSRTIISSFHSFYFFLFFRNYFYHFIF